WLRPLLHEPHRTRQGESIPRRHRDPRGWTQSASQGVVCGLIGRGGGPHLFGRASLPSFNPFFSEIERASCWRSSHFSRLLEIGQIFSRISNGKCRPIYCFILSNFQAALTSRRKLPRSWCNIFIPSIVERIKVRAVFAPFLGTT